MRSMLTRASSGFELRVGDVTRSNEIGTDDSEFVFRYVDLPAGNTTLSATLTAGDKKRGPYQVEVLWHDNRIHVKVVCTNRGEETPARDDPERTASTVQLHGGFCVPAGTTVIVPIWIIHRKQENATQSNSN